MPSPVRGTITQQQLQSALDGFLRNHQGGFSGVMGFPDQERSGAAAMGGGGGGGRGGRSDLGWLPGPGGTTVQTGGRAGAPGAPGGVGSVGKNAKPSMFAPGQSVIFTPDPTVGGSWNHTDASVPLFKPLPAPAAAPPAGTQQKSSWQDAFHSLRNIMGLPRDQRASALSDWFRSNSNLFPPSYQPDGVRSAMSYLQQHRPSSSSSSSGSSNMNIFGGYGGSPPSRLPGQTGGARDTGFSLQPGQLPGGWRPPSFSRPPGSVGHPMPGVPGIPGQPSNLPGYGGGGVTGGPVGGNPTFGTIPGMPGTGQPGFSGGQQPGTGWRNLMANALSGRSMF